ncbi:hypothetical protein T439DRAFT_118224 [Meredithblackwellia eburnea MCA 4105]
MYLASFCFGLIRGCFQLVAVAVAVVCWCGCWCWWCGCGCGCQPVAMKLKDVRPPKD